MKKNQSDIHDLSIKLRDLGVGLEQEDDASGYLGVMLEHDTETGLLETNKSEMVECLIEVVGLDDGTTHGKYTPAEASPLVKYEEGKQESGTFIYSSFVDMILYLSVNTRPDVTYDVK